RFTRILGYLSGLTKSYEGEVVLGTATSTLDASGEVTGVWDMRDVTLSDVRKIATGLTGRIEQVPPMVSAVKVGGRRLHELARAGVEVDRFPRPVTVHRLEVDPLPGAPAGVFEMKVECSTGTYIRSLAAEIGAMLGGGAHLRNLRRTSVGSFTLEDAHRVGGIDRAHVIAPADAVRDMSQVTVGSEIARLVAHGLALDKVSLGATGDGPWALLDRRRRLLAVYKGTETDRLVAGCVLSAAG
ncbi:MAG TPA: hypothetical protein VEJ87_05115, partial [Acidimicrobiales bacterium]|nr:hypothetical protein [Acidimicrobiales bacterium]